MAALAALLFSQAANDSTFLDDAGNWAAIIAAAILLGGLVFGWFRQASHGLHVAGESVSLGADEEGAYVSLGVNLLNTAGIPLSYEITRFTADIGERIYEELAEKERLYIAPQQRTDWHGERQRLEDYELMDVVRVEVRYEIQYGRKSPALWWWRRAIRGSFGIDLPATSAKAMTLLAEQLDGPPTDTRVPLTSKTIFGWRL